MKLTEMQERLISITPAEKRYAVVKKGIIYTAEYMQNLNNDDRSVLLLINSLLWFTKDDQPFSNGIMEVDQEFFDCFNIDEKTVKKSLNILETNGFIKILDDNVIKIVQVWKN